MDGGDGSLQHDLSSGKVNGHDVLLDLRTWCSHTPGKGRSQARVPLLRCRSSDSVRQSVVVRELINFSGIPGAYSIQFQFPDEEGDLAYIAACAVFG
jgi:hypothetical protein